MNGALELSVEPDLEFIVKLAESMGASYAEARYQEYSSEYILVDNGVLREARATVSAGVGVRVLMGDYEGYASTNNFSGDWARSLVEKAIESARAASARGFRVCLCEKEIARGCFKSTFMKNPFTVDFKDKIDVVRSMYSEASRIKRIVSVTASIALERDYRVVVNSNWDRVSIESVMTGAGVTCVAKGNVYERVGSQKSRVGGWEFIEGVDWSEMAREIGELASKASVAKRVKPGVYRVVLDNRMIGIMLHEAFGHACEADHVVSGESVLEGRIGEVVASRGVSIVDAGCIEGGCFLPVDDEGCLKSETVIVEDGVLKSFLHSRYTGCLLDCKSTGNARAMNYSCPVLVRQTNLYMKPGDYRVDELLEEARHGIYVSGIGSRGGEVDTTVGSFTFTTGPCYLIENGEVGEIVRSVMISGNILDTLKNIKGLSRELEVYTTVFGGCGKCGQIVHVGFGGPHALVDKVVIG